MFIISYFLRNWEKFYIQGELGWNDPLIKLLSATKDYAEQKADLLFLQSPK